VLGDQCRTCSRCLDVGERARWLPANLVDIGSAVPELEELTWTEKLLIQRLSPTKSFLLLRGGGTVFRGNFLTVEQQVGE